MYTHFNKCQVLLVPPCALELPEVDWCVSMVNQRSEKYYHMPLVGPSTLIGVGLWLNGPRLAGQGSN